MNSIFYFDHFYASHSIDRFLPDGNTEIVIDLTDKPKSIYDNLTLKEIQTCNQAWVSGIRTQPISIPSGNENRMLVINFRKGKAYPFYPLPLSELTDCVVDADLIFGDRIQSLREQLLEAANPELKFPLVEEFLLNEAGDRICEDVAAKCICYSVDEILKNSKDLQLKELADNIGYSQKHFISLFKKQIGVSPKTYLKITRFQKAVFDIDQMEEFNWSKITYENGYYDQSHFIHEFKKFSEFTPSEYLRKKSDQPNYVPIG